MANSQDIILTYKTDTSEVTKSFDTIESGLEGVDKKLSDTQKQTGEIGKGLQDTGRLGKIGFNAIGTAIKATGIGLLVGLVAKLIEKFTENKKVAEALEVVFNGIGAVINQLFEAVVPLGDAIMNAVLNPQQAINNLKEKLEGVGNYLKTLGSTIIGGFKLKVLDLKESLIEGAIAAKEFLGGDATELRESLKEVQEEQQKIREEQEKNTETLAKPFKQAAEAVTKFASDYKEEVTKAVAASTSLTKEQQALRDQQRELNVEYAEARAEIEQLKQQRDDERLSIEERIAAAERAAELDQQFAQERMDIANAEVALIEREIALQGDSIERQDRLAEARIAAAEAAESSAAVQTELMTSIYGLNQEAIAIEEERLAKEQEAAEERKRLLEEEAKLKEENAKKEIEDNRAVLDDRLAYANASLDALRQLNEAFAGDSEEEQKKAFQRNKAIGIAQAIINTAGAVVAAINPAVGGLGIPAGLPGAALAALTGAAQVATIARSQFGGGTTAPPPPSTNQTTQPAPTTPQLDLGFLGAGAGQTGFRTYVVSSEVTTAQQANQRINDQASLVG